MEISLHFVNDSDASSTKRKVALRLKGKPREDQEAAHLTIVLDTSGSMDDGNKLRTCKKSIGFIMDLMRDTDAVSLVTFDDDAKVITKCQETKAESKVNFVSQVNGIYTGGCTNMSAGLLEAQALLEPAGAPRKQGILLLTDGHANRGVYKPDQVFNIVKGLLDSREGVVVHTVGYGDDHNADLLSKIGEWSAGTYSVVSNLEDVATVFGSVLGTMVNTAAQNVKVTLPAGFTLLSQMPSEKSGEATVVRVGDIQSEVSTILLAEVDTAVVGDARVGIAGFDLLAHAPVALEEAVGPVREMSEDEAQNLDFAFVRLEIVALMKEVKEFTTPPANAAEYKSRLDALEARLATVPDALKVLAAVMKQDIQTMRRILEGGARVAREDWNLMTQHANVYAGARGLTSLSSDYDRRAEVEALGPTDTTPFVARRVTGYVGLMRTSSGGNTSPPPPPHDADDASDPAPLTRARRRQHWSPQVSPIPSEGNLAPVAGLAASASGTP
jgi:Mg-chelatase subunit ChlD